MQHTKACLPCQKRVAVAQCEVIVATQAYGALLYLSQARVPLNSNSEKFKNCADQIKWTWACMWSITHQLVSPALNGGLPASASSGPLRSGWGCPAGQQRDAPGTFSHPLTTLRCSEWRKAARYRVMMAAGALAQSGLRSCQLPSGVPRPHSLAASKQI